MTPDYAPFIGRMIDKYEGPYGWNKSDPGGPTKYGITCYDLAEHRGQKMTTMTAWVEPVKNMPRSEAEAIYAKKYAAALRFEDLGAGKDTVLLDYGVNSGDSRPIRVARTLLKQPPGSLMTADLVAAINKADPKWFINAVCDERLSFMHAIRGGSAWTTFGKGWGARVADLRSYSLGLAVGGTTASIVPNPTASIAPAPKANHDNPNTSSNATGASVGGSVVAGTAAASSGLSHWTVALIVVGVIILGVVIALYTVHKNTAANTAVVLPTTIPPQPAGA